MFKDAGWTVVEGALNGSDPKVGDPSKLGSAVSKHVGGGVVGVLMEIPDEFYIADQDAKEAKRKKTEAAMNEWKNQPGNYGEIKNK